MNHISKKRQHKLKGKVLKQILLLVLEGEHSCSPLFYPPKVANSKCLLLKPPRGWHLFQPCPSSTLILTWYYLVVLLRMPLVSDSEIGRMPTLHEIEWEMKAPFTPHFSGAQQPRQFYPYLLLIVMTNPNHSSPRCLLVNANKGIFTM